MQTVRQLIHLLSTGEFLPLYHLLEKLSLSNNELEGVIEALSNYGLQVVFQSSKGYRLAKPIAFLNQKQIRQAMQSAACKQISNIEIFDFLPSTNRYLKEKTVDLVTPTVCLAEFQTAGYGKQGRVWSAPFAGSICLSLLWYFDNQLETLAGLSLAVAVAVRKALMHYGVPAELALKWPNDLLWQEAKLAGILLETKVASANQLAVIIGIGLNVQQQKNDSADYQVVSLQDILQQEIDRNKLVGLLINEIATVLANFQQQKFVAYLPEWQQADYLHNKPVRLITGEKEQLGIACGVNRKGELLFKDKQGQLQHFSSGEVSLRLL